ncbi:uncharacterized protein OGAPODRAFT_77997 [Ogataea polymorpha]|uniref:Uncharacterized protein n=1 Tax=Ogataea polymorpha TaxID=460523 RepID=A0A1B7SAR2_9ASCO|nr:uncharacterized protein OGAPODRAFT_77997 [Ogataea polymorpha]KAH3659836.1 hypothetical protein OGATHE_005881 [Ogataea polymorpha]OBA13559.1 hypothetical protein OGAPODRAFT_77997 [Ogataea polymorpha]
MLLLVCLSFFLRISLSATITTTVASADARKLVFSANAGVLQVFLNDFASRFDDYTSYMNSAKIPFPGSLVQFYMNVEQASTDQAAVTSMLVNDFPMSEFKTYISVFPWYSSLLSAGGDSTIYLTEDLVSKTVAVDEESNRFNLRVVSATTSASATLATSSSAASSKSSSSSFSSSSVFAGSTAGGSKLIVPGLGLLLLGILI